MAVRIENPAALQKIDDSDFPVPQLQERACDDIFMIPGPARDTLKGLPTFALGAPYYGAGFVLICPPGTRPYLESLKAQQ